MMGNHITIAGKEYPLLLTVHGLDELLELMGPDAEISSLPNFLRGLNPDGTSEVVTAWDHVTGVLEIMLLAAEDARRMEAKLLDRDITPQTIPSADELAHLLAPGALAEVQLLLMRAATESMQTTMRADEKNGLSGETA